METENNVIAIVNGMQEYAEANGVYLNAVLAFDIARELRYDCDDDYVEFDVEELDRENGYNLFIVPNMCDRN